MSNQAQFGDELNNLLVPILTAEKFAALVGLPVGVVEAQLDRRHLPIYKIGKRRFINLEILRQRVKDDAHQPHLRGAV